MATRANCADAASVRPTANPGRLGANAWKDIRHAARLAREQGVSLVVHGVTISPVQEMPHQEECRTKGKAGKMGTESGPSPPQDLRAAQQAPSKRQQRSAARLAEYKHKKQHAAKIYVAWQSALQALVRHYRAYRRNAVWTEWMRAEVERAPMLPAKKRPREKPQQESEPEEADLDYLLGLPQGATEAAWRSAADEWAVFSPPA